MPFWRRVPVSPTSFDAEEVVAYARHRSFRDPKDELDFQVLALVYEQSERCFGHLMKGRGGEPYSPSGERLGKFALLETRAFFLFWANHFLWTAKQTIERRRSVIELVGDCIAGEYFRENLTEEDCRRVQNICEYRGRQYGECVLAGDDTGAVSTFILNIIASERDTMPTIEALEAEPAFLAEMLDLDAGNRAVHARVADLKSKILAALEKRPA